MIIRLLLFCLILVFPNRVSYGQEIQGATISKLVEADDEFTFIEVKLRGYMEELDLLVSEIDFVSYKRLEQIEAKFMKISIKHSFYCQTKQAYIAMNDSLMNLVASYQQLEKVATDLIQKRYMNFQMLEDFNNAELFIMAQDSIYARMLRQSLIFSQIEKMASELEKVKGQEKLISTDIEKQFQLAKVAVESIPSLKIRHKRLEEKYIELKNASEKIQSAMYQSFIQRIKDKLISIAAVGIILMLINTIFTKIQGYKQLRESKKKMEEMMRKAKNIYPKI